MRAFMRFYAAAFVRPRTTLDALAAHPSRVSYGAGAVASTAVVYSLVYFFLARNGGRPTEFAPWLAIPAEQYYAWNQWLCAPSIALAWVAAAGFAHLAGRALGGAGSYERVLGTLGLSIAISSWWTGAHDLVTTFLGFLGVLDQRRYEDLMNDATSGPGILIWALMLAYLLSFFVTFAAALRAAHGLGATRAAIAGATGVLVYQLVFVIFNR